MRVCEDNGKPKVMIEMINKHDMIEVEIAKRDTLQQHIKKLATALTTKSSSRDPEASVRSLLDDEVTNDDDSEDDECKIYYETICSTDDPVGCERVPVRLCAEGCTIQEGDMECER